MKYRFKYETPEQFSNMIIETDGQSLTGLWFTEALGEGESYRWGSRQDKTLLGELGEAADPATPRAAAGTRLDDASNSDIPVVVGTVRWLDEYFGGNMPDFVPPISIEGATEFRLAVIDEMMKIPYGETVTYGEIGKTLAAKRGKKSMSAQAVGGAVGWNPICIIVPCHRVLGSDGSITGYGGGVANKVELLKLEGVIE